MILNFSRHILRINSIEFCCLQIISSKNQKRDIYLQNSIKESLWSYADETLTGFEKTDIAFSIVARFIIKRNRKWSLLKKQILFETIFEINDFALVNEFLSIKLFDYQNENETDLLQKCFNSIQGPLNPLICYLLKQKFLLYKKEYFTKHLLFTLNDLIKQNKLESLNNPEFIPIFELVLQFSAFHGLIDLFTSKSLKIKNIRYNNDILFYYAIKGNQIDFCKWYYTNIANSIIKLFTEQRVLKICFSKQYISILDWILKHTSINSNSLLFSLYYQSSISILPNFDYQLSKIKVPFQYRNASSKSIYKNCDALPNNFFNQSIHSFYQDNHYYYLLANPRTGTETIINALQSKINVFKFVPFDLIPGIKYLPFQNNIRVFVRNPYTRSVSSYFWYKTQNKLFSLEYSTFEKWVLNGITNEMTLYENEKHICFIKQSVLIGSLPKSQIGKYENLLDDFQKLFNNNQNRLERINVGSYDHTQNYYSNQMVKDKIYQLYEEDFKTFNYD